MKWYCSVIILCCIIYYYYFFKNCKNILCIRYVHSRSNPESQRGRDGLW